MPQIKISPYVKEQYPGLQMGMTSVFSPGKGRPDVSAWNEQVTAQWDLETLSEHPVIKAYRDFFWKIHTDPTKTRPAAEALIRTAFHKGLPKISTIVDALNIASAMTGVPMSAFDWKMIEGDFFVRFANAGEMYYPHTGAPRQLNGNEMVLTNDANILCLYPYRDSKFAMITGETSRIIAVSYGVPGITDVAAPIRLMLQLLEAKASVDVHG